MDAYFTRDKDPQGGLFEVWRTQPTDDELAQRNLIQEVRKGDFPSDVWLQIQFAEIQPDPINHFDEYVLPHFEKAEVIWKREGGYVNGTE